MTVPTIEKFTETIDLIHDFHADDLDGSLHFLLPYDYQGGAQEVEEIVEQLIDKSFLLYQKKWEQIISSRTSKWLSAQPGTIAALKKRNKKSVRIIFNEEEKKKRVAAIMTSYNDMASSTIERWQVRPQRDGQLLTPAELSKIVATYNSQEKKVSRVRRDASRYLTQRHMTWECGIYCALRNYYFTDRWEHLYDESKRKTSDFQAAQRAIATLELASNHLISPLDIPGIARIVGSIKKEIDSRLRFDLDALYPVHRKDSTSRERVLVYDLFMNNKIHRMGRKSSLISNLMMVEGINNPLDLRTIERLIATWDAALSKCDTKLALARKRVSV